MESAYLFIIIVKRLPYLYTALRTLKMYYLSGFVKWEWLYIGKPIMLLLILTRAKLPSPSTTPHLLLHPHPLPSCLTPGLPLPICMSVYLTSRAAYDWCLSVCVSDWLSIWLAILISDIHTNRWPMAVSDSVFVCMHIHLPLNVYILFTPPNRWLTTWAPGINIWFRITWIVPYHLWPTIGLLGPTREALSLQPILMGATRASLSMTTVSHGLTKWYKPCSCSPAQALHSVPVKRRLLQAPPE